MLSCGGASNTNFQNITTDLDPIEALKSGQFDFAWVYQGVEVIQAEHDGTQLNVFPVTSYCVPDYYSLSQIGPVKPAMRTGADMPRLCGIPCCHHVPSGCRSYHDTPAPSSRCT